MTNDVQLLQNSDIEIYFSNIERRSYQQLQPNVNKVHIETIGRIKFTQKKSYRLTEDQYKLTPKIYSISLNDHNKQIVTLEFHNTPDFSFIKNQLTLHSAKYIFESIADTNIILLRIEENSPQVLAHFMTLYKKSSQAAADLIWEALLLVTEDLLDKQNQPGYATWKETLSYKISHWAEFSLEDDQSLFRELLLWNSEEYYNYLTKITYNKLSDQEKEHFLEANIAQAVKLQAENIISFINKEIQEARTIHSAFNSLEKCYSYIENNAPHISNFTKQSQNITKTELEKQFEPSFWEQILNSEKGTKHTKTLNTATKATISLLHGVGAIAKDSKMTKVIAIATDVTNIVLSGLYANKANKQTKEIPSIEEIHELSDLFICLNVICSHNTITSLTEKSNNILMKFYSSFIYLTIKNNNYGEENLYDFLLDQSSNYTYIDIIGLSPQTNTTLTTIDGGAITIGSIIFLQNKTTCYESLLKTLTPENIITNSTLPTIDPPIEKIEFFINNSDETQSYIGTDYSCTMAEECYTQ